MEGQLKVQSFRLSRARHNSTYHNRAHMRELLNPCLGTLGLRKRPSIEASIVGMTA